MPSIPAAPSSPPSSSSLINKSGGDLSAVDLICADMDGTLLSPDHNIPDITFNRINKADNNGCPVVPATGRCRWSAAKCFAHGGVDLYSRPGIYLNGCVVYDQTGSVAAEKTHSYDDVVSVVNNFKDEENVVIMCCSGDHVYAPFESPIIASLADTYGDPYPENCRSYDGMLERIKKENIPVHMIHIMSTEGSLSPTVLEKAQNFAKYMGEFVPSRRSNVEESSSPCARSGGCTSAQSLPFLTDIIPAGAHKGFGVDALKEKLGYKCVACVGDALNDYQMLKEADISVAMGNAIPQIKVGEELPCHRFSPGFDPWWRHF
ncbi:hypothetical protein FOZ60_002939 [Perkinsus olseni]|uniref:Phosphatase n=1 Tax=Perkinsus olseni TaxID=32597 RepID=A0A7J6NXL2_PEROL|nr:hypothetical protein FOZ60_002939 [Perkinsus olseni]